MCPNKALGMYGRNRKKGPRALWRGTVLSGLDPSCWGNLLSSLLPHMTMVRTMEVFFRVLRAGWTRRKATRVLCEARQAGSQECLV